MLPFNQIFEANPDQIRLESSSDEAFSWSVWNQSEGRFWTFKVQLLIFLRSIFFWKAWN